MEVHSVDDLITNPLQQVSYLCNQDASILHRLNDVGQYFKSKLNGEMMMKIPCINEIPLESIPSNSLVRFRGMIQDMFDPEFFLGKYCVRNNSTNETTHRYGCFTDLNEKENEEIDFDNNSNLTLERQTYFCVSIPGESKWLRKMFKSNSSYVNDSMITIKSKRRLDEVGGNEGNMMDVDDFPSNPKKPRAEDAMEEKGDSPKKVNDKFQMSIPLPNENNVSCFVSIYSDCSEIKLNDVVEFVGILSRDSPFNDERVDSDCDEMPPLNTESSDKAPSLYKIPSIHCLFFNKLSTLNPAIILKSDLYESTVKEISSVRNDLIQLLTRIFGGDATAAEYFLIHLISRTYAVVGTCCVGKFSLNLTNCPPKFPSTLYALIENVVEKSYYFPLTVDDLNKLKFTPKKDYEANKLLSGVLQLSSGTNLLLDETAMQPGQLEADGLNNLKAIGNLIQWQNVEYDFKFSKVEMKTDVNVLVFSEGRSMLKCDCRIPISSNDINIEDAKQEIANMNSTLIEKVQIYLGYLRTLDFNLTEEVSKALEEDFVEMRKLDTKNMTAETFAMLLTTARYMALSYGLNTLDASLWIRAKELDTERRKRSS